MEKKRQETEFPSQDQKTRLPKMLEYSAHDSNIFSFLNALQIHIEEMPPYASAIMLELHKAQNQNQQNGHSEEVTGSYFVKVWSGHS